jgi:hypothetical protein
MFGKLVLLNLCFLTRRDDCCSTYQILILWGRLVTCGRLAIGPIIFLIPNKADYQSAEGYQPAPHDQYHLRRSRTVGQPIQAADPLSSGSSRLKAGCGQDCPPHRNSGGRGH